MKKRLVRVLLWICNVSMVSHAFSLLIDEVLASEQQLQHKVAMVDIFDPVMNAYSNGDLEAMDSLIRKHCSADVSFKVPSLNVASNGVNTVLAFWTLLHELFPDAMIKTLYRRIGTLTTVPKSPRRNNGEKRMKQSVEYVYKFKATRLTNRPIEDTFKEVLASGLKDKDLNHEEISRIVARCIGNIPPQFAEEQECTLIVENIFMIDAESRILNWSYDILASDMR